MSTADRSPTYTQYSSVHTETSCGSKNRALSVKVMKRLLWFAVALLTSFVTIVCGRTLQVKSRQLSVRNTAPLPFDATASVDRFAHSLRYATVSNETGPPDPSALDSFRSFLQQSFPLVHARLRREVIAGDSLLFTWAGADEKLSPILLLGHMDVVPIEPGTEGSWIHLPFSGDNADGYIWGRGAMDDKITVMGILEAAEALLKQGFQPHRTVYFAFGYDEEIGGLQGAKPLAETLALRAIKPAFTLDEGGYVLRGIIPGYSGQVAIINTAEKGYATIRLRAETAGGHSAFSPKENAIGIVSEALVHLDNHPYSPRMPRATEETFEYLAPEMPFSKGIFLSNLWFFKPLVLRLYARNRTTEILVRTTMSETMFNSGVKDNVVPTSAEATLNFRLLPGDTVNALLDHLRGAIGDTRVKIEAVNAYSAPPESSSDSEAFRQIARSIRETFHGAIVAPGLLAGSTDSRHYSGLGAGIYRFVPMELGPADVARAHGINERLSVSNYIRAVEFYGHLILNSSN
jgi:carboxypeptidase PM20D1